MMTIRTVALLCALMATSAVRCSRKNEKSEPARPCIGHLERVDDPRSLSDLIKLPEIGPWVEIRRANRDPGFLAMNAIQEGEDRIGAYRMTWSVDSDRGRPGPADVAVSLPDLCDGGELTYRFAGMSGPPARLLHDAASGVDVLLISAWPQPIAIPFKLVPGPAKPAPKP